MEEPCPLSNPQLDFSLRLIEYTREKMRTLVTGLRHEQLFKIPQGFHNNILWNFGHVLVAQQVLCYKMSGLPLRIPSYVPAFFGKGTRPSEWTGTIDPAEVLGWHAETMTFLREDLENHRFKTYEPYTPSIGVELHNIGEALIHVAFHDALHFGIMMSQRKLV